MKIQEKRRRLKRRKERVRAKIKGTKEIPRFSVYRSLSHIYVQIIDDQKGVTLVSADDHGVSDKKKVENRKTEKKRSRKQGIAFRLGKEIALKAKKKKISRVVFDRGGRAYHGQIKAVACGAREGGLKF